jgi:hypothetical protein
MVPTELFGLGEVSGRNTIDLHDRAAQPIERKCDVGREQLTRTLDLDAGLGALASRCHVCFTSPRPGALHSTSLPVSTHRVSSRWMSMAVAPGP